MNSIEFATKLNALCGEACQAVDRKEIEPSNIIGTLTIQATQLTNMFAQIAYAKQQQNRPRLFVPGQNHKLPNGL
jgi:hypothetical protein